MASFRSVGLEKVQKDSCQSSIGNRVIRLCVLCNIHYIPYVNYNFNQSKSQSSPTRERENNQTCSLLDCFLYVTMMMTTMMMKVKMSLILLV